MSVKHDESQPTLYRVYIHRHGSTAKTSGLISNYVCRGFEHLVTKIEIVIDGSTWGRDDAAYRAVTAEWKRLNPRDERPLAGKSYIRDCRMVRS